MFFQSQQFDVVSSQVAIPQSIARLTLKTYQELVSDEVFGPHHLGVLFPVRRGLDRRLVPGKVRKVVLEFALVGQDLLRQQVLLIQEKDHADGAQPPEMVTKDTNFNSEQFGLEGQTRVS